MSLTSWRAGAAAVVQIGRACALMRSQHHEGCKSRSRGGQRGTEDSFARPEHSQRALRCPLGDLETHRARCDDCDMTCQGISHKRWTLSYIEPVLLALRSTSAHSGFIKPKQGAHSKPYRGRSGSETPQKAAESPVSPRAPPPAAAATTTQGWRCQRMRQGSTGRSASRGAPGRRTPRRRQATTATVDSAPVHVYAPNSKI